MKLKSNVWKYGVGLVCVIVMVVLGMWYLQERPSGEYVDVSPLTIEFYKGNFSVSGDPILNTTVELAFTLVTMDDAPNTTIKIFLPEEIELMEGNLVWSGDIKKDEKIEHKISIKVVKEGEWGIRAWVENEKFSGFDRAFFCYVDSDINSGNLRKNLTEMQEVKQKAVEK